MATEGWVWDCGSGWAEEVSCKGRGEAIVVGEAMKDREG